MTDLEGYKREKKARSRHRHRYWQKHDYETYTCPECRAGLESVKRFEVHHIDENPLNGSPENLVGLCYVCHLAEHGQEPRKQTVSEWKQSLPGAGGVSEDLKNNHTVYSQSMVIDSGVVETADHDRAREGGLARRICEAVVGQL